MAAQVVAEPHYVVTDLGTLGGLSSEAYGINASGQVVGQSTIAGESVAHAFLYSNGVMLDLGTMGFTSSRAVGIDSAGRVIGRAFTPRGPGNGFIYANGTLSPLPTLGGTNTTPYAMNDEGDIVGVTTKLDQFGTSEGQYSFVYADGQIRELLGSGDYLFSPKGINSSGQVIGQTFEDGFGFRAALYSGGRVSNLLEDRSIPYAINSQGTIVGRNNDLARAFLYSGGNVAYLAMSVAYSINNSGQVVGEISIVGEPEKAGLYSGGQVLDLNSLIDPGLGWFLRAATGINDSGQIIGFGTNGFGQNHAFLLTPIPEPVSVGWWAIGLVVLIRRRWKY